MIEVRDLFKSLGAQPVLKGVTFQIAHLKCPSCVNKGSPMPSFSAFSNADLRQLAIFLEASKGPH